MVVKESENKEKANFYKNLPFDNNKSSNFAQKLEIEESGDKTINYSLSTAYQFLPKIGEQLIVDVNQQ